MGIEVVYFHTNTGNIQVDSNIVHSYHIHTHTYYEMTLYYPFDGEININDHTFSINSLTCTLIAPTDYHSIVVNDSCNAKFIKIGFTKDILASEQVLSFVVQNLSYDSFIVSTFNEILNNKDDDNYLAQLINVAISAIEKSAIKFDKKINSPYNIVTQAIKIIDNTYFDQVNESEIATTLGVTPQYLSYLFKTVAKISFNKYLIRVRLKHAVNLLLTTSDQITKICYDCGYNNFSHFLRSFKREYGLSPAQYRKSKLKNSTL